MHLLHLSCKSRPRALALIFLQSLAHFCLLHLHSYLLWTSVSSLPAYSISSFPGFRSSLWLLWFMLKASALALAVPCSGFSNTLFPTASHPSICACLSRTSATGSFHLQNRAPTAHRPPVPPLLGCTPRGHFCLPTCPLLDAPCLFFPDVFPSLSKYYLQSSVKNVLSSSPHFSNIQTLIILYLLKYVNRMI